MKIILNNYVKQNTKLSIFKRRLDILSAALFKFFSLVIIYYSIIVISSNFLFSQTKENLNKSPNNKKLSSQEILNNLYNEIDSLGYKKNQVLKILDENVIDISKSSNLIDSINHIINITWNSHFTEPKIGVHFINKIISLYENETNPERRSTLEFYIGKAFSVKAHCHLELWENDSTYIYFSKSLFYRKRTGDPLEIIWGYNNISQYFNRINDIDSAAYYLSKAVDVLRENSKDFHFLYSNSKIISKVNNINAYEPLLGHTYFEIMMNYHNLSIISHTHDNFAILTKKDDYFKVLKEFNKISDNRIYDARALKNYYLTMVVDQLNIEIFDNIEYNLTYYRNNGTNQNHIDKLNLYAFVLKLAYFKNKITKHDWQKIDLDTTLYYNPLELSLIQLMNIKFSVLEKQDKQLKIKEIFSTLYFKLNHKEKQYVVSILNNIFKNEMQNYEYFKLLVNNLESEDINLRKQAKNSNILHNSMSNLNSFHQFIMSKVETYNVERFYGLLAILFLSLLALSLSIYFIYKNRKLTKKLAEKNTQLDERNQINKKIYGVISHDISAPVEHFNTYLTIINSNIKNENYTKALENIDLLYTKANFINNTLDSLLNFMKFDEYNLEVYYENINIRELLNEIIEVNQDLITQKNIHLEIRDVINELFSVRTFISTILRNLIQNSIKFSYNDSKIILEFEKQNNKTIIKIHDFGLGITENRRQSILAGIPMTAGKDVENKQSSAFGFLLIRDLILKLNGNFNIEHNQPSGTIVIITLPDSKIK